jgi:hypothetical protein
VNALDAIFLTSMGALVAFFASLAMWEWRDARALLRTGQADAQVIERLQPDQEISSAA